MKIGLIALSIVFGSFWILPELSYGGEPLDTVQLKVNKVIEVLRSPTLKAESAKEKKEKKIQEIIDSVFDYKELSRRALGRNWRKFNKSQQKEFTELFSKLLRGIYIDKIIEYTNEKVVFDKENMITDSQAEVHSRIITASKEIPVDYMIIQEGKEWKVYDVVIEGVSLIKNYRSQFNQIMLNKSPEELIEMLRKKVEKS